MKPIKVAVVGSGRVGLPLALVFAQEGYQVFGVDTNLGLIAKLKSGRLPFREKGAAKLLKKHLNKNFFPTTSNTVIAKCQYIILTLGTPVDENMNPSLVQIETAFKTIKPYFKPGQTLILRSTVSPGTTQYVADFIGRKINLAFCPERIAEGKAIEELYQIPQIIGGINPESGRKAAELFKVLKIKCWQTDPVSAELAKLFTNMYRYISFAIANEFMILANKYNKDIYEIVNLVNRDYKRGGLSLPGLTGGACLFKDGFFLINDIPFVDLIATAWKINESIPLFFIDCIKKKMNLSGKKTVILGAAFKANIDDIRESLSFKVKKALERASAKVVIHDPLIPQYNFSLKTALTDANLVFIATKHDYYLKNLSLKIIKRLAAKNCLVCDVWNIFDTNKIIFQA